MSTGIRVFVGAAEPQRIPALVLKRSIISRSEAPISFVRPICDYKRHVPLPRDKRNRPRTPFSFQRFLIPFLCNYKGRAIYLDSDMLVLGDIEDLWNLPFPDGAAILCGPERLGPPRMSVLLLDTSRLPWKPGDPARLLNSGFVSYEDLMQKMEGLVGSISPTIPMEWNSLDRRDENTRLIHYTDMQRQPWLQPGHPLEYVWMAELLATVEERYVQQKLVHSHISRGYIRQECSCVL
jgi:hypothetical protein